MKISPVTKSLCLMLFFFGFFAVGTHLAFALDHEFAGTNKCGICHKKPDQGQQFTIWQNSAHAKAFATLATPQAKEAAAAKGIADPQKSGECLKCHSTAYYFTTAPVSSVIKVEEGVSCESCHGPGKDYMKKTTMENRDAAIAAGMVVADESTCVKCHNAESPTFKSFNYAEMWEKIKHPVPKK